MTHPYTTENNLPNFGAIDYDELLNQTLALIDEYRELIDKTANLNEPLTWENLFRPSELMDDRFEKFVHPLYHLEAVKDSPEVRETVKKLRGPMVEFSLYVSQHKRLAERIQEFRDSPIYDTLSKAQKKVVDNKLKSYQVSGIFLEGEKKERFNEITKRLSELDQTYGNTVLDAKNSWIKHVKKEDAKTILAGIPKEILDLYADTAEEKEMDGYVITLDHPSYGPVLKFADNRELRREVLLANSYVASEFGENPEHDVTDIINEILQLRHEKAKLLGFDTFADVSIYKKMAESKEVVVEFIEDLIQKSFTKADAEERMIIRRARQDGIENIEPWDISYYKEKILSEQYQVDEKEIKKYFGVSKVLEGFFDWATNLYGITFELETEVEFYEPSVAYYHVLQDGERIAGFMTDLYARSEKRSGAWMMDFYSRMVLEDGTQQLPVASLNCNYAPPVDGKDSLLNFRDIETLYHEFGHCLHHMMTKIDAKDVAGISGVEWDAVELPSQMMENWCWDYEVLSGMSSHVDTGEKLPKELFDKMVAAKNAFSGMACRNQMEMSMFDMLLHIYPGLEVKDIWKEIQSSSQSILPDVKNTRWFHSFHHVWGGSYAAGYFSYKWAEVLSADCFSKFEEEGLFNQETGKRFRDLILANGGSIPMIENVREFLGRDPNSDALLRHTGLI